MTTNTQEVTEHEENIAFYNSEPFTKVKKHLAAFPKDKLDYIYNSPHVSNFLREENYRDRLTHFILKGRVEPGFLYQYVREFLLVYEQARVKSMPSGYALTLTDFEGLDYLKSQPLSGTIDDIILGRDTTLLQHPAFIKIARAEGRRMEHTMKKPTINYGKKRLHMYNVSFLPDQLLNNLAFLQNLFIQNNYEHLDVAYNITHAIQESPFEAIKEIKFHQLELLSSSSSPHDTNAHKRLTLEFKPWIYTQQSQHYFVGGTRLSFDINLKHGVLGAVGRRLNSNFAHNPHINEGSTGNACLGGFDYALQQCVSNRDWDGFVFTANEYVHTIDIRDTWGKLYSQVFLKLLSVQGGDDNVIYSPNEDISRLLEGRFPALPTNHDYLINDNLLYPRDKYTYDVLNRRIISRAAETIITVPVCIDNLNGKIRSASRTTMMRYKNSLSALGLSFYSLVPHLNRNALDVLFAYNYLERKKVEEILANTEVSEQPEDASPAPEATARRREPTSTGTTGVWIDEAGIDVESLDNIDF